MSTPTFYHTAVLLHECIDGLNIKPDGIYLDATFGGGGHSKEILKKLGPTGKLIVFDQDADAKQNAPDDDRLFFIPENFRYAARFVRLYKIGKLDGVLADLGVSSYQFDTAEKGFSIRFDAPLDMRMDQRGLNTAEKIINSYTEKQLQDILEQYGEVTNAKTLAKKIVDVRSTMKLQTIQEFKQAIATCVYGNPNKYLAQVFQALRIEVNQELDVLKEFLSSITDCLNEDGRLCVITFHSLEDRIVKNWMKNERFEEEEIHSFLPTAKIEKKLKVITKKPILPSDEEQKINSRSRSAKLRIAERKTKNK